ncbi:MAG: prolyl oligopeptidase family serine peptidase, partial [Gammaproteobacteria bacterium]|nr:prolyl oligopeptidase family serine peptidase [Gammaproteobacteria bacterium]
IDNREKSGIPERLANGVPARPAPFATGQPMASPPEPDVESLPLVLPAGWDRVESDLLRIYTAVLDNYRTDRQRVYLSGVSYGGFGTWYMASKHPQLFAAIAAVVGWGHPALMPPIAAAQLPVWVFAGGRDTAVLQENFYPGLNRLEALGHRQLRFTSHQDMEHDAWTRVYAGQDIYDWLLSHSLDAPFRNASNSAAPQP